MQIIAHERIKNRVLLVAQSTICEGNLGLHVTDTPYAVYQARARFFYKMQELLGASIHLASYLEQVHGNRCIKAYLNLDAVKADAQYTDAPRHLLCIMTADCIPCVVFCPKREHLLVVHAGARGLAQGVLEQGIRCAHIQSGARAYLGAHIRQAHYQVSYDYVQMLLKSRHAQAAFWSDEGAGHGRFDLSALAAAKLNAHQIAVQDEGICSHQDARYFSHRRSTLTGAPVGRMVTAAVFL